MELQTNNNELTKGLYKLCAFTPNYYKFPGGMPISLSKQHINRVKSTYSICDKTDGKRFLMLGYNHAIYFVDRLMNFFKVGNDDLCYGDFVFDGELVEDKSDTTKQYYMIFDVFAFGNRVVKDVPNHEYRLNMISQIFPRKVGSINVQVKRFYLAKDIALCIKNTQLLPYDTDGYIFTPMKRKIFNGTDKGTFKWKHGTEHTIDFELQQDGNLYLWDKNSEKVLICKMLKEPDIEIYTNGICIVECELIKKHNSETTWRFVKVRDDKERPNSLRTYLSTIDTINENITEDYLNFNLSIS